MIGTALVEELVQTVAVSHRVKDFDRVSLLLMAAPESGKTSVARAANCSHVQPVAIMTGRSILREMRDNPHTEFFLFNDLTAIRALSPTAVAHLITLLNQIVQGEKGKVAYAGKETESIDRTLGIIGCIPFRTFTDHRARWKELGFVSRMIPFSYSYSRELIAEIKDAIDDGSHVTKRNPRQKMRRVRPKPIAVSVQEKFTRQIRHLADARADELGQLGIRLLKHYHCIVRAHAVLHKRNHVTAEDVAFLRAIDQYVSITQTRPLEKENDK
jgi:hypothetical protein